MKPELNTCSTCEHKVKISTVKPCSDCIKKSDFINWTLPDWVKELIAEAEKRGFEAARKGNNVSDITDYQFIHVDEFKYQTYEQWKEENK